MKLKQRLAIILAAAMIMTSIPVVTMGASTNRVTKVVIVEKDTVLNDTTTGAALMIDAKDSKKDEVFYLELENAEWKDGVDTQIIVEGAIINAESKTTARVQITEDKANLEIPMLVKVTGGEASIIVVSENSSVTGGKYIFAATTTQDKATVNINFDGKEYEIYDQGEIAEIRVSEMYPGQLSSSTDPEDRIIRVEIYNPNIEFVEPSEENIVAERGLEGIQNIQVRYGKDLNGEEDRRIIEVELPYANISSRGIISFKGLEVIKTDEDFGSENLTVVVSGNRVEPTKGTVATIKDIRDTEIIEFKDNNLKQALIFEGVDYDQDGVIVRGEMKKVLTLNLRDSEISDLTGLEYAVNLENLNLSKNNIQDITPIKQLKNLKILNLSNNYLDISAESSTMKVIESLINRGVDVQYTPQMDHQKSSNANLSNLMIDKGVLNPVFNGEVTNYSATVENTVESIEIDALVEHEKAMVVGTGKKDLQVGVNNFDIVVTAEDGITTKTYSLAITREGVSNPSTGGGGGGGGGGAVKPPTLDQAIEKLTDENKEAIINNFKENLPYTSLGDTLTIEQLRKLTNNLFTDKQLQEILEDPEMLKVLDIDLAVLDTNLILTPIKNAEFEDVPQEHWASESIKKVAELGVVAGMPDGTFAPNATLQIADTFTFLDRVLLLNGMNDMKLSRSIVEKYITNKDHWAFANMASVASKLNEQTLKEVTSIGENPISRELLAQVLYEITDGKLSRVNEGIAFEDVQDSYYINAIDYCIETGLLNGTSEDTMSPSKALTRAELMTILIRLDELIK